MLAIPNSAAGLVSTSTPHLCARRAAAGTRTSGVERDSGESSAPTPGRAHSGSTHPGQVPSGEERKAAQRVAGAVDAGVALAGSAEEVEDGSVPHVGHEGLRARGLIVRYGEGDRGEKRCRLGPAGWAMLVSALSQTTGEGHGRTHPCRAGP